MKSWKYAALAAAGMIGAMGAHGHAAAQGNEKPLLAVDYTADFVALVDTANIRTQGSYKMVWMTNYYPYPRGDRDYKVGSELWRVDCRSYSTQGVYGRYELWNGEVDTWPIDQSVSYHMPLTIGHDIVRVVCEGYGGMGVRFSTMEQVGPFAATLIKP